MTGPTRAPASIVRRVTMLLVTVAALLSLPGLSGGAVAGQAALRVVAYNVKHGLGMDGEVDLARIASVLRPFYADVITLQEIDRGTGRTEGVDQARRLAGMLGMTAHFGSFMPYDGGEYGMAVLTRLPVLAVENIRLPDGEEPRTVLDVRVAVGLDEQPVSVVGVHLYRTEEERLAQAGAMSDHFQGAEHPVILAGDFNSQRGGPVLDLLTSRGWAIAEKTGDANTFPADAPVREIDFVMYRPEDALEVEEHYVIEESVASDHRPLLFVARFW
jgi:endonuclease/exonuclease/phosphatase family metal-dependent hydrolase